MSLTFEKVPAFVFTSDDADAPQLPRNTTGAVRSVIKACLHTGYGSKPSAGWSMPYESLDDGVTVLRPPLSPEQDFYLRLSVDDGRQITPQVYFDMTDKDTGELKLQCDTAFKYGTATSGKWLLIATERGFWLFIGCIGANGVPANNCGSYIYCGDTASNTVGNRAIYLKHTGGTSVINTRYSIYSSSQTATTIGKLWTENNNVYSINPSSYFQSKENWTQRALLAPLFVRVGDKMWGLPAYSSSTNDNVNYDVINTNDGSFINHSTTLFNYNDPYVLFVNNKEWLL